MSNLTEILKVRLDPETKAELDRQAAAADRTPGYLARILIRTGLAGRRTDTAQDGPDG